MSELHDLLARATNHLESPRLEQTALQVARRRRTRRRGAAVSVLCSALVATTVVGLQLGDRGEGRQPAGPADQSASSKPSPTPSPSTSPSTPPSAGAEKVWPQWDPRDVDGLPAAPDRVAPALPDIIDPPASSPPLGDDPVGAAVLTVEQDDVAQLLLLSGEWRTVPADGAYPVLSLSRAGTRLAVHHAYDPQAPERDSGVTVHDLVAGTTRTLEPPGGLRSWDTAGWVDDETLMFSNGSSSYVVDVGSGEAEEVTVPDGRVTMDPEGRWLVGADFEGPNVLTDYADGTARTVSMDRTGRLLRIQASEETVVGTTYDDQPFSLVVADRETLTPQHRLPVLDHDANYSNWGLNPLAVAEDGTVVLQVAAIGPGVDGFRLVAWDPPSGELSVVTSTALPVEATVVFAQDAVRAVGPG